MMEFISKHKWAIAGGGLVLVIGFIMLSGGSTEDATTPAQRSSDSSLAAGYQLQALQTQAGVKQQEISASKEIALAELASNERVAELNMASTNAANNLAAQISLAQTSSAAETRQLESSLDAQVESARIQKDLQSTLAYNATIQKQAEYQYMTTQAVANAQTKQTQSTGFWGAIGSLIGAIF